MSKTWLKFPCTATQLRLDIVLASGQSFRWKQNQLTKIWTGVIANSVWELKQDGDHIAYFVHEPHTKGSSHKKDLEERYSAVLEDYFNLNVNVEKLFQQWCKADRHFADVSKTLQGMRTLRLDPVENTFSFICSSNNNIPRITSLVNSLCRLYGKKLRTVGGEEGEYFTFPGVHALAGEKVEQELRDAGFGYRAKFINQSAKMMVEKHKDKAQCWLSTLRDLPYAEARAALVELPGIGPKVADCICLMSLDKAEAIPVDTHVWQITVKNYMPLLSKSKSLTDKIYKQIGDHYRTLFGEYAGWAHSVLFAADLKNFQHLASKPTFKQEKLNPDVKKEVDFVETRKEKSGTVENVKKRRSKKFQDTKKEAEVKRIRK